MLLAAALGALAPRAARAANGSAKQEPEERLTLAEFEHLHRRLQPPVDEAWRALPWRASVLEARAAAARERKPVYMLVRSGHPLGCV
jgi:hypothetical protein